MTQPIIEVENLSKLYHIGHLKNGRESVGRMMLGAVTTPFKRMASLLSGHAYATSDMDEPLWALKDVSFKINQGEVVGIIGRNGAGKSTLLKVLSRIIEPSGGRAVIRGRIGSLLEVGTGFHPDLSGRENVYLNGSMLGMSRKEIQRKFDEIVEFSEVEKFIDTPVKHYSSGMYTRLAFAVAAHLTTEVLIVDEVLAVGDYTFQQKCLEKMEKVARDGRTVLFVSHNLAPVRRLCDRGLVLQQGQLLMLGNAEECINYYMKQMIAQQPERQTERIRHLVPGVRIEQLLVNGEDREQVYIPPDMEELSVKLRGRIERVLRGDIEVSILDMGGSPLGFFSPAHESGTAPQWEIGRLDLTRRFRLPRMLKGEYRLTIWFCDPNQTKWIEAARAVTLIVEGPPIVTGTTFSYHEKGWLLLQSVDDAPAVSSDGRMPGGVGS